MAIIVREFAEDPVGGTSEQITYRSTRHPLSEEDVKQAKTLDAFLSAKMKEVRSDLERKELLTGRRGEHVYRWYAVGCHLRDFIDDPSIVPPEDRIEDRYIWAALWAHAPDGVRPGSPKKSAGTLRDHFRLCYELAKFPVDVVERFTWSDWVNFLESPAVATDGRVTHWAGRKLPLASGREALRALARVLRNQFRNRDLSVLTDDELNAELEWAWRSVDATGT